MKVSTGDGSLIVDISDALSERDRVRFTVHTQTKLPQFAKPVLSVVRQHEEFIWLHDCIEDNDQYAGYIIPPAPPRPDFDTSREKLQRLGDSEANMTKEEFTKMKQELEAEYLSIFKKTVAMHEIFLQRLAAHEKFREDNNFKIFLEYENELAVRGKTKKERIAGSIQNIGKSLQDFVITTSQVAATTSASTSILAGKPFNRHFTSNKQRQKITSSMSDNQLNANNLTNSDNMENSNTANVSSTVKDIEASIENQSTTSKFDNEQNASGSGNSTSNNTSTYNNDTNRERLRSAGDDSNNIGGVLNDPIDEQYFEKQRLFLALYYNSIKETAIQADKVTQAHKCVADSYLQIAHQMVKLASIEVVPITAETKDSSKFISCTLPSLTMPASTLPPSLSTTSAILNSSHIKIDTRSLTGSDSNSSKLELISDDRELGNSSDIFNGVGPSSSSSFSNDDNVKQGDNSLVNSTGTKFNSTGGCANKQTSEGLKQSLLNVSDYLEQARKIETRIASDEDLKLTDTFLYYKRDTLAAQELLMRRLRFMAEYENATKNLEKNRHKGRTQMQYADVIQKQAKENFISISKLAKQELTDYKQRRVASFKKAFADLVDLELKHLRSHTQAIVNCLNICRGLSQPLNQ